MKIKKKIKPLKLGFIGGGLSSTIGQTHFSACRLDGCWQLQSGFFSRKRSVNKITSRNWNINSSKTFSSLGSFLSKEKNNLDAAVVLTPTPNHYETILKLIKLN